MELPSPPLPHYPDKGRGCNESDNDALAFFYLSLVIKRHLVLKCSSHLLSDDESIAYSKVKMELTQH